jgi:hypothetical protein
VSVPSREAGKTAVALLLLARTDQAAVDELLGTLSADELLDLGRWLTLVLSDRCGWATETMQGWRLREELAS